MLICHMSFIHDTNKCAIAAMVAHTLCVCVNVSIQLWGAKHVGDNMCVTCMFALCIKHTTVCMGRCFCIVTQHNPHMFEQTHCVYDVCGIADCVWVCICVNRIICLHVFEDMRTHINSVVHVVVWLCAIMCCVVWCCVLCMLVVLWCVCVVDASNIWEWCVLF